MRIDLLLLDVDGVLVQYQRAQRVLHLAHALQVPTQAVQAALYDSGLEAAHDNGTLDGPAYLAQLGELLGTTVDVAAWTAARRAASHPQAAVLQRLQALQLPMAVLTNNGALMQQALPTLLPELFPALQGACSAARISACASRRRRCSCARWKHWAWRLRARCSSMTCSPTCAAHAPPACTRKPCAMAVDWARC
jgi:hypothetical protein